MGRRRGDGDAGIAVQRHASAGRTDGNEGRTPRDVAQGGPGRQPRTVELDGHGAVENCSYPAPMNPAAQRVHKLPSSYILRRVKGKTLAVRRVVLSAERMANGSQPVVGAVGKSEIVIGDRILLNRAIGAYPQQLAGENSTRSFFVGPVRRRRRQFGFLKQRSVVLKDGRGHHGPDRPDRPVRIRIATPIQAVDVVIPHI